MTRRFFPTNHCLIQCGVKIAADPQALVAMQVARLNWVCLERWDSTFLVPFFLFRPMVRGETPTEGDWNPRDSKIAPDPFWKHSMRRDLMTHNVFDQTQRIPSLGRDLGIPMPNWMYERFSNPLSHFQKGPEDWPAMLTRFHESHEEQESQGGENLPVRRTPAPWTCCQLDQCWTRDW